MGALARALAVLMLWLSVTGCASGAASTSPDAHPQPSAAAGAAESGSDVGNGRPQVSYDGLMVRRRVVVAVRLTAGADSSAFRRQLDLAATRTHSQVRTISPTVLDPIVLERLAPDLAVALAPGASRADGRRVADLAFSHGRRASSAEQAYDVRSVLVHDLRFTVPAAHPAALSRAIAREGIVSDALGNYAADVGDHQLAIVYTGPLLSDHLLASVRSGIARPADLAPGRVTVAPRSTTGSGVDMAREPAPPPEAFVAGKSHHHH